MLTVLSRECFSVGKLGVGKRAMKYALAQPTANIGLRAFTRYHKNVHPFTYIYLHTLVAGEHCP